MGRAQFLRTYQTLLGLPDSAMRQAARQDLDQAARADSDNPLVLIALSEEWLQHGQTDRAAEALDRSAALSEAQVAEHFIDPDKWRTLQFRQRAKLAMMQGEPADALAEADALLAMPLQPALRLSVLEGSVALLLAADRTADARQRLDEYIERLKTAQLFSPEDAKLALLRALVLQGEDHPDKWQRIIRVLQPATADRGDPRLLRLLGQAYARTGQPRLATRALSASLQRGGADPGSAKMLVEQYLAQGRWQLALATARPLESAWPDDVDLTLLRLQATLQLAQARPGADPARLQAVSEELEALRQAHPRRVEVRLLQSSLAAVQDRPDEALAHLRQALEQCDRPERAQAQLARLLFAGPSPQPEQALQAARAAAERAPDSVDAWTTLAELLERSGQVQQARQALEQALSAVGPDDRLALQLQRALLEIRQGRAELGTEVLDALAREHPYDLEPRVHLLSLPSVLAQPGRAQRIVDEIRAIEGDTGLLWRLQQARLWLAGESWPDHANEIAAYLNACLGADPGWTAPGLLLGELHERQGDLSSAEAVYRAALQADPADAETAIRLIALLQRQGRPNDARRILARSDATGLDDLRVQLALAGGDGAGALAELRRQIELNPDEVAGRVMLARLVYAIDGDAEAAFALIDQAQRLNPDSLVPLAGRVAILRSQGEHDEVERQLAGAIEQTGSAEAVWMRATYRESVGDAAGAEQDYRRLAELSDDGNGWAELARFLHQAGRTDEALAELERGLAEHPDSEALHEPLLRLMLDAPDPQRRQRGRELLAERLARHPNDPELLRTQAALLLREGTPNAADQARDQLDRLVRAHPRDVEAWQMRITLAMQEHDFASARRLAALAVQRNPGNGTLRLSQAQAELQAGQYPAALQSAQAALAQGAEPESARQVAIVAARAAGDQTALQRHRAELAQALAQAPDRPDLRRLHAKALAALGQVYEARADLADFAATTAGQDDLQTHLHLAELHRQAGDSEAAQAALDHAAALAPADAPEVLRERIRQLQARGDLDALAALMAERADTCRDPAVLAAAGAALGDAARPEYASHAQALYAQAVELAPRSVLLRLQLAQTAYQAGDAERAIALYRQVLQLAPDHPRALNDLAWILAEQRDYQQAIRLADRGVQVAPDDRYLRDTRGVILSQMPNRQGEARADFTRAVELTSEDSPARARALAQLGRLEIRLGQASQARPRLQAALAIDRDQPTFSDTERAELQQALAQTGP